MKDNKILSELQAADTETVVEAIQGLRKEGNSAYIPDLVDLLHATTEEEVKQKILTLLSDLKDVEVIPELVKAIQNEKYEAIQQELATVCWENGLDFTQHLETFVDLVIEKNFMVALEAFTVIENMVGHVSDEDKDRLVEKVKHGILSSGEEKKAFLMELITIIPKIQPEEVVEE